MSKLDLADFCDGSEDMGVGVLVGIDFYYSFIKSEHGPVASHSILGWVLSGTVSSVESCSSHCFEIHTMKCEMQRVGVEGDEDLRALLTKFWEVESVALRVMIVERDTSQNYHFDRIMMKYRTIMLLRKVD